MKKIFLFLAAASLVGIAACNKTDSVQSPVLPEQQGEGQITFSLAPSDGDVPMTRAVTAYTTAQTYESKVNKVQILIFSADGKLAAYQDNGTSLTGTISTTAGTKTVWAVINGPSLASVSTLSAFQATALDLSANSTNANTGFVMAGSTSCNVTTTGTVPCNISVSRLVSRVALVQVTNALPPVYGAMKVERIFLANVVGHQNFSGNASPSTWYNKDGRADETTRNAAHIIDGSTYKASCEDLTYKSVAQTVNNGASYNPSALLFYSFPNSSTTAPAGFASSFAAKRSVLTVVATVDGKIQYYPVVLDSAVLERNKTYTVGLTITGPGSDDPNKPVEKGSVNITLTVAGWVAGATYDETI